MNVTIKKPADRKILVSYYDMLRTSGVYRVESKCPVFQKNVFISNGQDTVIVQGDNNHGFVVFHGDVSGGWEDFKFYKSDDEVSFSN